MMKTNPKSNQHLECIDASFYQEKENEQVTLPTVAIEKLRIDGLVKSFFNIFTNLNKQQPNWNEIYTICLPQTIIIKKSEDKEEIYSLDSFAEPRKKILSDGTLTEFEEYEISEETSIFGSIAQRCSRFQKNGYFQGIYFEGKGNKLFQFVKTSNGWKISAVIWEDEKTE